MTNTYDRDLIATQRTTLPLPRWDSLTRRRRLPQPNSRTAWTPEIYMA